MLSPVSLANCSLIWRVGLGVWLKAVLRISNCLALMVVLGPRLLPPTHNQSALLHGSRMVSLTWFIWRPVLLLQLVSVSRMERVANILVIVSEVSGRVLCLDLGQQSTSVQQAVVVLHLDGSWVRMRTVSTVRGVSGQGGVGGQGAGGQGGLVTGAALGGHAQTQGQLVIVVLLLV